MKIELCMGSSCFARGNAAVLEQIEQFMREREDVSLELTGHLCLEECSTGPNIRIDGTLFQGLSPQGVLGKIEQILEQGEGRA